MKKFTLLLCLFCASLLASAQNNVIKFQPQDLLLSRIDASFEHATGDRGAWVFSGGVMLEKEVSLDLLKLDNLTLSGWSLWPQYRFYPGVKDAPQGFYMAPYLSYSRYQVAYTDSIDLGTNIETTADGIFSSFTAGGMIGIQWIFDNHLTIDWNFLGVGYSLYNLGLDVQPSSNVDMTELAEEIDDKLSDFPIIGKNIDVSAAADKVQISLPVNQLSFRTGFSIGIAF